MRVDEARKVLLVRAVETVDCERSLLSDSMRIQADRQARDVHAGFRLQSLIEWSTIKPLPFPAPTHG